MNVSTSDGFAGRWLVPRLYRFHRAHDDIDVRVSTTGKLTNFLGDGIDVAIRYGGGSYPGLTSEFLTGEEVFRYAAQSFWRVHVRSARLRISNTTR